MVYEHRIKIIKRYTDEYKLYHSQEDNVMPMTTETL